MNGLRKYLLILCCLLYSAGTVLAENTKNNIKVGIFQLAPLVYIDDNGLPQGIFVDIIDEIAEKEKLNVEYVIGSWSEGLEGVKKGQLDLMTTVMHLERRESFLDFPKESVFNIWGQIYTHKNIYVSNIFDLEGKTVGVLNKGANGQNFISLISQFGIKCDIAYFDSQEAAADALSKKSIDAAVFTNVHGYHFQLSHQIRQTQIVFDPSYLKYATTKGENQQLLKIIDAYLSKWKADQKSIYYKIVDKHLGLTERKTIPAWVWRVIVYGAGSLAISLMGAFILMVFNRKMKEKVKEKTQDINKRMKELKCLYTTSKLLENSESKLEMIFQNIVEIIPAAWQYPEITCSKIIFNNQEYRTDKFKTSIWKQSISIIVDGQNKGSVEVYYLKEMPKVYEGPFLMEERDLINEIADRIGRFLERRQADEKRHKTEKKLKTSEEKYRSMMESMDDSLYICSPDFRIEYMNSAMIKSTGYDACGETCHKVMHGLDEKCPWCIFEKIKKGKSIRYEMVSPKDNKTYQISNSPIFNADGSVSKLSVFRDVTRVRELEKNLQQSQKMESIGVLAGGIAHDFNNILFPIIGHSEMVIEDLPDDSPFTESLNEITGAALRARDLVQQILTFSRQDNSELNLMKVQPVIKEALKLIRSTIPTTIEITQDIQPACRPIKADPTKIHQIVMNLATNAYHAMEENGGKLNLGLKEVVLNTSDLIEPGMNPGEYACLSVSDTGVGMAKELTKKIFDPFFTTKEKGKGTGMGLSVVHGVVKGMNGSIQVHSSPDKGTEFKVYFPIEKSFFEKQSYQTDETIQGGTERILVVDDEIVIVKK